MLILVLPFFLYNIRSKEKPMGVFAYKRYLSKIIQPERSLQVPQTLHICNKTERIHHPKNVLLRRRPIVPDRNDSHVDGDNNKRLLETGNEIFSVTVRGFDEVKEDPDLPSNQYVGEVQI